MTLENTVPGRPELYYKLVPGARPDDGSIVTILGHEPDTVIIGDHPESRDCRFTYVNYHPSWEHTLKQYDKLALLKSKIKSQP